MTPLSRRVAEGLLRGALGATCNADMVSNIVERAGGNAFYLEEFIRAVVDGRGGLLPETVLGMVEARLATLPSDTRKVLRAASIFGETFWERGVVALLGKEYSGAVQKCLRDLIDCEVIISHANSRLLGETQYAFRHALVREGAYAMLTDGDLALGHVIAAEWLIQIGDQDPMVLAAHFDRGRVPQRAAEYYARAAEQAMRGMDLDAAILRAEKGLDCGPTPDVTVALNTSLSIVYFLNANHPKSYEHSVAAIDIAGVESLNSALPIAFAVIPPLFTGNADASETLIQRLLEMEPSPTHVAATANALTFVHMTMIAVGKVNDALQCFRRLEEIEKANPQDLLTRAQSDVARTMRSLEVEQDLWQAREYGRRTIEGFQTAGARQYIPVALGHLGWIHAHLGLLEEASVIIDGIIAAKDSGDLASRNALFYRCLLLLQDRKIAQSRAIAEKLRQIATDSGDFIMSCNTHLVSIECLLLCDQFDEAEQVLTAMSAMAMTFPSVKARYVSLFGELRRCQGRFDEAVWLADQAVNLGRAGPRFGYGEAPFLLRYAEALRGQGDIDGSRRVILEAREDLHTLASRVPDAEVRRAFLDNIPHRRRILALAQDWLQGD
ncbi:MAG TPA: hypothetical protein PK156_37975 [Polyangium sp.]|nr:hypothetical protein [Polyangium sp.]